LNPGENTATIIVTSENGNSRIYTVKIKVDCQAPRILKDLEDATVCRGGSHTFEIRMEGNDLTYEWYKGNNRIWGAMTNTLTISNVKENDYEYYQVVVKSDFEGFKANAKSKRVRLWIADPLPETLKFVDYPKPAITGQTYRLKLAGYPDVTKYTWGYRKKTGVSLAATPTEDNDDVTFNPSSGGVGENESFATFGPLSVGNTVSGSSGTLIVTLEHPCGTKEFRQDILVKYPTGMENTPSCTVQVFPNPTTGQIKVFGTRVKQAIRITDITGALKGVYSACEETTTIDLSGYARGAYLLQYGDKTFKVIRK
jgi:hypothetical protein